MYDIYIDDTHVAFGLSKGELNQWLLDLDKELCDKDKITFRNNLGFTKGNFEDFLYNNELTLPIYSKLKDNTIQIQKEEF